MSEVPLYGVGSRGWEPQQRHASNVRPQQRASMETISTLVTNAGSASHHLYLRFQSLACRLSASLLSNLELSDTQIYEPSVRAPLGTAAHSGVGFTCQGSGFSSYASRGQAWRPAARSSQMPVAPATTCVCGFGSGGFGCASKSDGVFCQGLGIRVLGLGLRVSGLNG